ncbi:putative membrane protein YphA (DoxX/SURF4 family) [Methylorubrum rhodinum]|uniref:Putative membrane protein YphA (DoxX/SURF4 family) n=1 Tax=Methylorubrum rhodinum TaxID=29428 RepID=A0A840ZDR9_9HYPH|nr:DoxX family protein [Methylorubrum rhodinum]MBB5755338.1 putative membrane protein YphA (DoxX/SURF4 family) [Methylorubrum rhodinum]
MFGSAQNGVLLAARLLMAAALLPTGIARALNVSGFALTLAGAGCPAPNAVATAAVIVQVFGPLALILGVMPRVTGLAMALFVAAMAALLHPFWHYVGGSAVTERSFFLADLGLAGAFLMYAMTGPGAWSWQGYFARSGRGPEPARAPARAAAKNAPAKRAGGRAPARAAA